MRLQRMIQWQNFLIVIVFGFSACTKKVDKEKYELSYTLGTQFARNLKQQNINVDGAAVGKAVTDMMAGNKPDVSDEEMAKALQRFNYQRQHDSETQIEKQVAINYEKSQRILETNKATKDIVVTPSGLQYKIIAEGHGRKPKSDDKIVVKYRGVDLINSREFISTSSRNLPETFAMAEVMPGWQEGLGLIKKGGKVQLFMPSNLAYPKEKWPPDVPPGTALLFEIELVDVGPTVGSKR